MLVRSSALLRWLLAAVTGCCLALVATAPTSTAASPDGVNYYTVQAQCQRPTKGHAQCFAMKRLKVAKGTRGARPLTAEPGYATGPAGGYTPGDLATAYGVNSSAATAQTVAIVDAYDDPNALSDLNTFNGHYGLPKESATSFRKVGQTGSASSLPAANAGWAGEISLDVDAVRGLCHACKILLVEANSSSFSDLAAAENRAVAMGATIVSNSYGGPEGSSPGPASLISAYNHPGVVILASTGDDGYEDWDHFNTGSSGSSSPESPSSLNTVVGVAGTSLFLNDDATRSGESVWNENGLSDVTGGNLERSMGATGGGCSLVTVGQGWQTHVANWAQTGCGTRKSAADISALADPYTGYDIYDSYQSSGWQTYGGTSLASPLIGAMWALAGGAGGVSYPSLSLYGHLQSDTSRPFFDVVTGGNGLCGGAAPASCANAVGGSPNTLGAGVLDCAWLPNSATLAAGRRECDAATGYDGSSGIGTPSGVRVFTPMNPTARVTKPATVTHGSSASFSATTSSDPFPGGSITSVTWNWGDGSATTTGMTVSHTYAAATTSRTITLTVRDNYGRSATTTVTFAVK